MIAIKHEIDSVQLVKDEIDDIRESLDRLEAESQRRKNKLLEQVKLAITLFMELEFQWHYRCHLILVLILADICTIVCPISPLILIITNAGVGVFNNTTFICNFWITKRKKSFFTFETYDFYLCDFWLILGLGLTLKVWDKH